MNFTNALNQFKDQVTDFEKKHGLDATQDALSNGAFLRHPDRGDLTDVIKYRDFNESKVTIPEWVTDVIIEHF